MLTPTSQSDGWLPDLFTNAEWHLLAEHYALTPRQHQIARLACRGLKREAIAVRLGISVNTVRTHTRMLFDRLEVDSRLGLLVSLVLTQRKLRRD